MHLTKAPHFIPAQRLMSFVSCRDTSFSNHIQAQFIFALKWLSTLSYAVGNENMSCALQNATYRLASPDCVTTLKWRSLVA